MAPSEAEGRVYTPSFAEDEEALRAGETKGRKLLVGALMTVVVGAAGAAAWNLYAGASDPVLIQAEPGPFKTLEPSRSGAAPPDREVYDVIEHGAGAPRATAAEGRPALTRTAAPGQPPRPEPLDLRAPAQGGDGGGAFSAAASGGGAFAPAGPFMAQLAAVRSEDAAEAAWRALAGRSPGLVRGARMDVQRADLGPQGVFYRLRVGYFAGRQDAGAFCAQAKAGGQDCMVVAP